MDDFLFLADSYNAALLIRQRVESQLEQLGRQRNPKKGVETPTQVGDHLGLTVDLARGMFRAPPDKLYQMAQHASNPARPSRFKRPMDTRYTPTRSVP
jgi:hypothetical protein